MDQVLRNMKPHVDQYIGVYDFEGAGFSNCSMSHIRGLLGHT